jgi:hypothetical protein
MKHCPACNFSFPDFYKVCDFDGTPLVADPESLSLVKPSLPSRLRSTLQSPVFWGGLLAFVVVSNTFLFALYDARKRSTLSVNAQPSPAAPAAISSVTPAAQTTEWWPDLSNKPAPSTPAGSRNVSRLVASPASPRRQAKTARTPARPQNTSAAIRPNRSYGPVRPVPGTSASRSVLSTESANKQQPSGPARRRNLSTEERPAEIARRSDSQKTSPEKEGKLTGMLKATWRVLKKPFRF